MGGSFFFRTSWLCGFAHMRCTPDSDLAKAFHELHSDFGPLVFYYFAFVILSKCKPCLIGEYHEFM